MLTRPDLGSDCAIADVLIIPATASAASAATRTAAACAAAASRLNEFGSLLATRRGFSATLLFRARSREQVRHRVVPFVAAVLKVPVAVFTRDWQSCRPRSGVGLWIVHRDAVVERVGIGEGEPLDQHAFVRQRLPVDRRLWLDVARLDDEHITFPAAH